MSEKIDDISPEKIIDIFIGKVDNFLEKNMGFFLVCTYVVLPVFLCKKINDISPQKIVNVSIGEVDNFFERNTVIFQIEINVFVKFDSTR